MFTIPAVASLGLQEKEAIDKGIDFEKLFNNISKWTTSRRLGMKHSAAKVLIDKSNRLAIGAHLMGHYADEVINLFSLTMRYQLIVD